MSQGSLYNCTNCTVLQETTHKIDTIQLNIYGVFLFYFKDIGCVCGQLKVYVEVILKSTKAKLEF